MKEEDYMRRCLDLALKAQGQTYPNPMVGCVIVHNNEIIGEGYHQKAGEAHAEINAINAVRNPELLAQSTIYVSLEPCAHYGKTPPCAEKLAQIGFKKVVIGALDSHKKVNGKGVQILQNAGIEVRTGILEKECRQINRRFFTFHQKNRPYIILKWAEAADGFLDREFQPVQIGNPVTKQFVHELRSQEHAILVGTTTAINDNPSLTTRDIAGRNPIRILIDMDLKVPSTSEIFNEKAETVIFNGQKSGNEGNLTFIKIEVEELIDHVLTELATRQIQSVIVEGGSFTLQQFIDKNLWDEVIIIKNRKLNLRQGTSAPTFKDQKSDSHIFGQNVIEFYQNIQ